MVGVCDTIDICDLSFWAALLLSMLVLAVHYIVLQMQLHAAPEAGSLLVLISESCETACGSSQTKHERIMGGKLSTQQSACLF